MLVQSLDGASCPKLRKGRLEGYFFSPYPEQDLDRARSGGTEYGHRQPRGASHSEPMYLWSYHMFIYKYLSIYLSISIYHRDTLVALDHAKNIRVSILVLWFVQKSIRDIPIRFIWTDADIYIYIYLYIASAWPRFRSFYMHDMVHRVWRILFLRAETSLCDR